MNKNTELFLEELKSRPEVLGVIMFGSWARGNNRPDSDVDLVVILTEGYRRTVKYKNDQAFEIIYTTAQAALEFWREKKDDCAGLWAVAKILYDKNNTVTTLKGQVESMLQEGKKPVDKYQKGQYEFSMEDEIRAVEALRAEDEATANLVLSHSVNRLTGLFFDLKQLWTPAPKQRLMKIKEIEPQLGLLFEAFYKSYSLENKIRIAKEITSVVFKD